MTNIIDLFSGLNLAQKLPRVNFRILSIEGLYPSGLIIQNGRMVAFGNLDQRYILQRILDQYPTLNYINQRPNPSIYLSLVDGNYQDFVEEADFGLVDPSQPPGPDNPSITFLIRHLVRSRALQQFCFDSIIFLYARYHRLTPLNQVMIEPDHLLQNYFDDPIDLRPIWNHLYLNTLSNDLSSPQLVNLHRFNVPRFLSSDKYKIIVQQIESTIEIYQAIPSFYLEDGTIVDNRPSV